MLQLILFAAASLLVLKGISAVQSGRLAVNNNLEATGKPAKIAGIVLAYCGVCLAAWALLGLPTLIAYELKPITFGINTGSALLIAVLVCGLSAFAFCRPDDLFAATCLVPALGCWVVLILYALSSLTVLVLQLFRVPLTTGMVFQVVLVSFVGLLGPLLATTALRRRADYTVLTDSQVASCPQCGRTLSVHTRICPSCETRISPE